MDTDNATNAPAYPVQLKPETLYDTLHDAEYRAVWDENMIEGKVIQQLDDWNEVGYYSARVCLVDFFFFFLAFG
jgi:hypothetical protein